MSSNASRPSPDQLDAAIRRHEHELAARPNDIKARYNLALLLIERNRRTDAARQLEAVLALTPGFAPAAFTLGRLLIESNDLVAAERLLRAAASAPATAVQARFSLADLFQKTGRLPEAAAMLAWIVDKGAPTPGPYMALASLILEVDTPEALRVADLGLQRFPGLPQLMEIRGLALVLLTRFDEAIDALRNVSYPHPTPLPTLGTLLDALRCASRWDEETKIIDEIRRRLARGERPTNTSFTFGQLHFPFDGTELRKIAEINASPYKRISPLPPTSPASGSPLVIGYLSPDYRNHPIAHLVADIFAAHDPAKVRAVAFSEGPDDGASVRRDIAATANPFIDLRGLSDRAAAERIRAEGTHILVDLALYTQHHRAAIAAYRPAPVQVAWLGLPATTGAPWFDYVFVDDIVAPPAHADRFSEALVHLPCGYQPNRRLAPLDPTPSRAELELPEEAVVFACFNGHLKIDRDSFAAWMKILSAVPGSVLWLLAPPDAVAARYRAAAKAAGVAPERLVFAPKASRTAHLARLLQADLMLDTLIYGAHTTCSDALRAGVPMLTVLGDQFAARVAASLVTRAGVPELVCADRDAFVAEAIRLGRDAQARAALKQKLATCVPASPVFDPAAQARALEDAYAAIWAKHLGA